MLGYCYYYFVSKFEDKNDKFGQEIRLISIDENGLKPIISIVIKDDENRIIFIKKIAAQSVEFVDKDGA